MRLSRLRVRLERAIKRVLRPYFLLTASRQKGLEYEVAFWDKWFRKKGGRWPEAYRKRLNPALPLSDDHQRIARQMPGDELRILDVGSGPLTNVGKVMSGKQVTLVAADPLAHEYDKLLTKYRVDPPVRTRFAEAEELSKTFGEGTFDLVNASNSIDHSRDPMRAIEEMIRVTRPGGYMFLVHSRNEAEKEGYAGLHQWNLDIEGDAFVLRSRTTRTDVCQAFAKAGTFKCWADEETAFVEFHKNA